MDTNIEPKLVFRIEQVALCPTDPAAAIALLTRMCAGEWARDHVKASGNVFGAGGTNEADLAFDYEMLKGANELEVLHYTDGPNWMDGSHEGQEVETGIGMMPSEDAFRRPCSVSHLGMHCSAKELLRWRKFMADEGFREAQSVRTFSHTNPVIKGKRSYQYVIYDTRAVLGVDIKFIVRLEA